MKLKKKSIKTIFIAISVAVILVIFAAQTIFSMTEFNSIVSAEVRTSLINRVEKDASVLNSTLGESDVISGAIAKDIIAMPNIQIDLLINMVKTYIAEKPLMVGAGFWFEPYYMGKDKKYCAPYVYKDGNDLKVTWDYSNDQYNYFQYDWYKNGITADNAAVWSEPYADSVTGVVMVTSSYPIKINGKNVGCTTVDVGLKELQAYVKNIKVGNKGYAFIVTKDGYYLAHKQDDKNLKIKITEEKDQKLRELGETIVKAQEAGMTKAVFDGNKDFAVYAPIGNTGMKLVLVMPERETSSGSNINAYFLKAAGIFILALVLFALALNFLVTKLITKPLDEVVQVTQKVADGDLSMKEITTTRQDEIGNFINAFNKMLGNLRTLIEQISYTAKSVIQNAEEMGLATDQIATSSESQSASSQETLSSMEELDASIQNIAKNVEKVTMNVSHVTKLMQDMRDYSKDVTNSFEHVSVEAANTIKVTESSKEAVEKSQEGTNKINQTLGNLVSAIKGLGKSAVNIGEIVDVIDDIAEQTNLLALNAAIEAARAGEHGKGFAVVAGAIRNLAEKSGEATKEIAKLIKGIQEEVREAEGTAKEGTTDIENGAALSKETEKALAMIKEAVERTSDEFKKVSMLLGKQENDIKEIVEVSEEIDELANSMAATVQQQTVASSEVVKAVDYVSQSANEIAVGTKDIAKSTEGLANEARKLSGAVSRFKV